ETREVGLLVLFAFATQQIAVGGGDVRALPRTTRHLERQRGEVRALDVVVQIGGREDEATVGDLHLLSPTLWHWRQGTAAYTCVNDWTRIHWIHGARFEVTLTSYGKIIPSGDAVVHDAKRSSLVATADLACMQHANNSCPRRRSDDTGPSVRRAGSRRRASGSGNIDLRSEER